MNAMLSRLSRYFFHSAREVTTQPNAAMAFDAPFSLDPVKPEEDIELYLKEMKGKNKDGLSLKAWLKNGPSPTDDKLAAKLARVAGRPLGEKIDVILGHYYPH